jgi:hypothetical protein
MLKVGRFRQKTHLGSGSKKNWLSGGGGLGALDQNIDPGY